MPRLLFAISLPVLCLLFGRAGWAEPSTASAELASKQCQAETVRELTEVGNALISWLTDVLDEKGAPPQLADDREIGWSLQKGGDYYSVSYEEVVKLLVPTYLEEVPRTDCWGHGYEFTLNSDLSAGQVLGIRSAGRDEKFETNEYITGSFPADEYDRDTVWNDGYFVRWPSED